MQYLFVPNTSVVRLTLLYISYQAVIPAKAGIQFRNPGFRVKPGMTIKVKGFLTHYTRFYPFLDPLIGRLIIRKMVMLGL